jgi:hypothetical protein
MAKIKYANITAMLYDREFSVICECPGRCSFARFFIDPPEDDDECSFSRPGAGCLHPHSQRAALDALNKEIIEKLKQFDEEA